jgi:C-terminal processing protease CtpA/Prc
VLLRYRLVLDYAHARLFVDPSGRVPDASATSSRVGVAVRFGDDGCPEVRQVTDTNAADTRAKIQIGDVIMTIDGRDACKMFHHEIAAALAGAPGTMKKLGVRRGGSTVDVTVVTAELLAAHP